MFYFKDKDGTLGMGSKIPDDTFTIITQEEYVAELKALSELEEQEQEINVQDMVVQEQAKLLTIRANLKNLSSEDAAYIENRLDAISDYWDSKEGQVTTYGTD